MIREGSPVVRPTSGPEGSAGASRAGRRLDGTFLRAVPALLAVALSATFVMCTASSPSNPFAPEGPTGGGTNVPTTNLPSIVVIAQRFDLNADGGDNTTIIANAKDASGNQLAGAQVLWSVTAVNFAGGTGTLQKAISLTDGGGQAIVQYTAPKAEFVPVGALEVVTGQLVIPNNPQGSPKASVTILLRPKGTPAGRRDDRDVGHAGRADDHLGHAELDQGRHDPSGGGHHPGYELRDLLAGPHRHVRRGSRPSRRRS